MLNESLALNRKLLGYLERDRALAAKAEKELDAPLESLRR